MQLRLAIQTLLAGTLAAMLPPLLAQNLPATPPTAPGPLVQPLASAPQALPGHSRRRAQVDYAGGQLAVTADNSSLNQILADIARLTGLKIIGGVTEERVFGTYGPADTSSVLSALLDGTGSNMLLLKNSGDVALELVLTPRAGGPTPPSPTLARTQGRQDEADLPPQAVPHVARPGARPVAPPAATLTAAQPAGQTLAQPPAAASSQAATQPEPAPAATLTPSPDSPAPAPDAAAGTVTQQSPNGVKTPQQIYDQLMLLQQQQPKQPQ